jgi:16S rRNA (adenine1518-N6/adenine1519-N6)-dimethyltransferase
MDAILNGPLPSSMTLLLQRETAERFAAAKGSRYRSAITIRLLSAFDWVGERPVPSHCFHPVPKVQSRLIHLQRREFPFRFSEKTQRVLRQIFNHRRKQLHGCLGRWGENEMKTLLAEWWNDLRSTGLDTKTRAEELPLEAWWSLENHLQNRKNS